MNRGKRSSAGYTIVETMIFLAVSAAMFLSAMIMISGRQARAEFNNSIRDFESGIQDIANDVSDGYYANVQVNNKYIECHPSGTDVTRVILGSQTSDKQGANKGCIFIGKSMYFDATDRGKYYIMSLVGKRVVDSTSNTDAQNYLQSGVVPIAPTSLHPGSPDATTTGLVTGGVTVDCVFYGNTPLSPSTDKPCTNTTNRINIDTVTFMTTFQAQDAVTGQTQSGSAHVDLVVPSASLTSCMPRTLYCAASDIDNNYAISSGKTVINPVGGVYVCLQSNGTNQHALLSLGGKNSRFTTATKVEEGSCR